MKKCPHCQATANPLRLFGGAAYVCPNCKARSFHEESWTQLHLTAAGFISAAAIGLLYERVPLLQRSMFCVTVFFIAMLLVSFVAIRWAFGRLVPATEPEGRGGIDPGECPSAKA